MKFFWRAQFAKQLGRRLRVPNGLIRVVQNDGGVGDLKTDKMACAIGHATNLL